MALNLKRSIPPTDVVACSIVSLLKWSIRRSCGTVDCCPSDIPACVSLELPIPVLTWLRRLRNLQYMLLVAAPGESYSQKGWVQLQDVSGERLGRISCHIMEMFIPVSCLEDVESSGSTLVLQSLPWLQAVYLLLCSFCKWSLVSPSIPNRFVYQNWTNF